MAAGSAPAAQGYFPTRRLDRPEVLFWSLLLSAGLHISVIVWVEVGLPAPKAPYSAPVINVELALLQAIDEVIPDPWIESGTAEHEIGSAESFIAPQPEIAFGSAPDGLENPGQGNLVDAGQPDVPLNRLNRRDAEQLGQHDFSPGLRPRRVRRLHADSDLKTLETLYMNRWQRKVESVGALFFERELASLKGKVQVQVRIEASGRVRDIRVLDGGQNRELAAMVRRILRESAPFPPLPDGLAAKADILEIVRVWVFNGGQAAVGEP